jgi:hypothetical protein
MTAPTAEELEQVFDDTGQLVGWRVKSTATHHLDVVIMMFNYRIVTTRRDMPGIYDRYWCYAGRSPAVLLAAVAAAFAWDGSDDTEPVGWNKNGETGEWRAPETEAERG